MADDEMPYSEWENVCAICDDGGLLLCCEGGCLRSFHPTKEEGRNSACTSLDLPEDHRWEIFTCDNCRRKQHQCFACGLLGSSDSSSGVPPQVLQCGVENCGRFYHPECVVAADNVADMFRCPMHRCRACNGAENKHDRNLQFAVCRRCPTAYHRMCLPREIGFRASKREGTLQRAWNHVLTDRVLIYCTKHDIDLELLTPKRDHIVFPPDEIDLPSQDVVMDDEQEDDEEEEEEVDKLSSRLSTQAMDSVSAKQSLSCGDRILRYCAKQKL